MLMLRHKSEQNAHLDKVWKQNVALPWKPQKVINYLSNKIIGKFWTLALSASFKDEGTVGVTLTARPPSLVKILATHQIHVAKCKKDKGIKQKDTMEETLHGYLSTRMQLVV